MEQFLFFDVTHRFRKQDTKKELFFWNTLNENKIDNASDVALTANLFKAAYRSSGVRSWLAN